MSRTEQKVREGARRRERAIADLVAGIGERQLDDVECLAPGAGEGGDVGAHAEAIVERADDLARDGGRGERVLDGGDVELGLVGVHRGVVGEGEAAAPGARQHPSQGTSVR
jgi:hypothetical protein